MATASAEPPNPDQPPQQLAGRGAGAGGRGCSMVRPGTYTVQLGKLSGGTVTPQGEAQKVEVIPLGGSNR